MDNRGSKLTTNITNHAATAKLKRSKFVVAKEQRVDGNCSCLKYQLLRCTLMGSVSSYQIRILSKDIYKKGGGVRFYHTSNYPTLFGLQDLCTPPFSFWVCKRKTQKFGGGVVKNIFNYDYIQLRN